MRYFREADLIQLNELIIRQSGGLFNDSCMNVFNINSLLYLVDIVQTDLILSLDENKNAVVAAYYAFYIINDHIFVDGNKRTGLFAASLFLRIIEINVCDISDEEIIDIALRIESKAIDCMSLIRWFKSKFL